MPRLLLQSIISSCCCCPTRSKTKLQIRNSKNPLSKQWACPASSRATYTAPRPLECHIRVGSKVINAIIARQLIIERRPCFLTHKTKSIEMRVSVSDRLRLTNSTNNTWSGPHKRSTINDRRAVRGDDHHLLTIMTLSFPICARAKCQNCTKY